MCNLKCKACYMTAFCTVYCISNTCIISSQLLYGVLMTLFNIENWWFSPLNEGGPPVAHVCCRSVVLNLFIPITTSENICLAALPTQRDEKLKSQSKAVCGERGGERGREREPNYEVDGNCYFCNNFILLVDLYLLHFRNQ